jgi:hypothetical protein
MPAAEPWRTVDQPDLKQTLANALVLQTESSEQLGRIRHAAYAAASLTLKFTGGDTELQALLDKAPDGAVVMCEQIEPLTVTRTLTIARPVTLRGLKARLPEKLGNTALLMVAAKGVTLTDLELHGNYDSVPQESRAPLIHVRAGEFRVEQCKFFDGSKDGIMVTPDDGAGDIVGGVIRHIEGVRMGRDLVSLSGGCGGQRIRSVTVEHVRLKKGYHRGAVEVSDGSDNVTVRQVHAEDAVYAVDVQDHGAKQSGKAAPSAPNTHVTIEDVTAVNCKHVLRTANHDLGHSHLTLRNFAGTNCQEPVLITNTKHVRIQNVILSNHPEAKNPRITLRHCDDVEVRNVTIIGLREGTEAIATPNSANVRIEKLKR